MSGSATILRGNILIVDDQKPDLLLLKQMLRGAGYAPITPTMDPRAIRSIAIFPFHGGDNGTLIRSADLAPYQAKCAGKNLYRFSDNMKDGR